MEGSDRRWRGAITGEKERSLVKRSDCCWRGGIVSGVELSQEDESDHRMTQMEG